MSLHPPSQDGPLAVIIGCGDIAMSGARRIGQRHPLLVADVDEARLSNAAAALRSEGYGVATVVCDITNPRSVQGLTAAAREKGIVALAHVAALAPSSGDWRKLMSVNLIGPHRVAEALLPFFLPGAAAVFVSSNAANYAQSDPELDALLDDPLQPDFMARVEVALGPDRANPSQAYIFSKYALNRYCERLAVTWGPKDGVRVLSISPGLVLSSMGKRERVHNPVTATLAAQTPLRREASLLEIAAVIDFAVSNAASYLTGVDILIDGGMRAVGRAKR